MSHVLFNESKLRCVVCALGSMYYIINESPELVNCSSSEFCYKLLTTLCVVNKWNCTYATTQGCRWICSNCKKIFKCKIFDKHIVRKCKKVSHRLIHLLCFKLHKFKEKPNKIFLIAYNLLIHWDVSTSVDSITFHQLSLSILTLSRFCGSTSIIPRNKFWQSGGTKWGMWKTPRLTFSSNCLRLSSSNGKAPWKYKSICKISLCWNVLDLIYLISHLMLVNF